ncbi:unnamed protein product [Soboliphyme baturini]|uniref:G_PROTEIN_RECEP_F1_2 domain-containing protein n=1 Tax=Soboliphyme baturini TaxID=241478 RepID=A0A183IL75_9BILA|nr:unnamed protein product [Soboliphyme baturini]
MIFPPQIMIDYFEWEFLYHVWLRYVPYLYSFSRIVTVASSYLIVFCSLERYLEVIQVRRKKVFINVTHRQRYINITFIVMLSILFRIISIWEVELVTRPGCTGFASEALDLTPLAQNYYYRKIYQLWLVHLFQIFFPFTILVIANVLISVGWKKVARGSSTAIKKPYSEIRHSTSTARRMLIAIVTTYLISNLLNVIMTIWEHVDQQYLLSHQEFYSFSTDVVSILTSLNASLRLPIYFFTNWRIRKGLRKFWRKACRKASVLALVQFNLT